MTERRGKGELSDEKASGAFIGVLQRLGALFIGLGVLSLVAFNWTNLPGALKIVIIILAMISSYLAGFYFLVKRGSKRAGESLVFLGNLLYGAEMWLAGQIYHIHYGFSKGAFLWAIGVVPFAYLIQSRLSYFLSIALFFLWTLVEAEGSLHPHFSYLFVLLGILVPLSYHLRSKVGLGLCLFTGWIWFRISAAVWFEKEIGIYSAIPALLYGILLLVLSTSQRFVGRTGEYRKVYRNAGWIIYGLEIIILSFLGISPVRDIVIPKSSLLHYPSFIFTTILLLAGMIGVLVTEKDDLTEDDFIIRKVFPYLFLPVVFTMFMPYFGSLSVPSLFPVVVVSFAYGFYSRRALPFALFLSYLPVGLLILLDNNTGFGVDRALTFGALW